ncbi:glycoside hydrolase family 3 N-terminal domain-containing protein [Paralimibaculum aggregatum]|uniref:beta-N-acetylhexosaminidase n=1 Tax=Paralimibaculum aggregatum TaxID=3036245 RepID=A0ABQ6LKE2_9RHOB|nr:glycoside hydrolase family 3 N-terminal domain-containing protein [Limibaculum sp. NKW23]GMG83715.1 glycoside hydrolase family 3 N-terminal domain-containing protein [Limibaculum sp. NKW23]
MGAQGAASAAIYGLSGLRLTDAERAFLAAAQPWGLILFARNVAAPDQVRALLAEARAACGRHVPVFIDQEGGRVARLRPPHWRAWGPPAAEGPGPAGRERLGLRMRLIAAELAALGIDGNCAPMLDLAAPGAHEIVSSRVLADSPEEIAARGLIVAEALLAGGVLPVIKHIPGHGRARADSHAELPVVAAPRAALEADFAPFRALAGLPLAMTAHVVYTAIDPALPATLSPACIRLIREEIGFAGALMSDDIGMAALSGAMGERAAAALAAGCDLVLHCSGEMDEMRAVAAAVPRLSGEALARVQAAEAARRAPEPFDIAAAEARHAALGEAIRGAAA